MTFEEFLSMHIPDAVSYELKIVKDIKTIALTYENFTINICIAIDGSIYVEPEKLYRLRITNITDFQELLGVANRLSKAIWSDYHYKGKEIHF